MFSFSFDSQSALRESVNFVAAHAKSSINNIHKYLLLQLNDKGVLSLQATNGGYYATRITKISQFSGAGSICVEAAKFNAIMQNLPADTVATVKFEREGDNYSGVVQAGRSRFKLICLEAEAFPLPSLCENNARFNVRGADLSATFGRLNRLAPMSDCRPALNSICLELEADRIIAVASDGMRLAKSEFPITGATGADFAGRQLLIPKQQVLQLMAMARNGGDLVVIFDNSQISFICPEHGWKLQFSQLEGIYPNWRRVVPKTDNESWASIGVDREYFISCLERARILADGKKNAVSLRASNGEITLTTSCEGGDEAATEVVPCNMIAGIKELTANFNVGFLVDALRGLTGKAICMSLSKGNDVQATLISDEESTNNFQVVAQLRA